MNSNGRIVTDSGSDVKKCFKELKVPSLTTKAEIEAFIGTGIWDCEDMKSDELFRMNSSDIDGWTSGDWAPCAIHLYVFILYNICIYFLCLYELCT